jgi:hypothetical protein
VGGAKTRRKEKNQGALAKKPPTLTEYQKAKMSQYGK